MKITSAEVWQMWRRYAGYFC